MPQTENRPDRTRLVEHVMGLPVSVDIRDADIDPDAVRAGFTWLHEVDARFSPFRTDSEACRFDRGELAPWELHDDLVGMLNLAARYEQLSHGAFQPRIAGRGLDLCGVVKGWAVQRMADGLRAAGAVNFCVNAGGDVVTAGEPEPGRRWLVGIRHPHRHGQLCGTLAVGSAAVATSGNYERGQHILDGRTGLPARGLLSMTILGPDLTIADATATAAFAQGRAGIAWADRQPGCAVFAVTGDGRVHRSSALDDVLVTS